MYTCRDPARYFYDRVRTDLAQHQDNGLEWDIRFGCQQLSFSAGQHYELTISPLSQVSMHPYLTLEVAVS